MADVMKHPSVAVLVCDPNPHLSQAIKKTFGDEGLPNVKLCATADDFIAALDGNFIDLIVLDHLLPGPELAETVQRIRQRALGKNPFVTMIATVGKTQPGSTKALLDAGVDDIVVKPLTIDSLFKAVSNLTEQRRPFVISPDYVGPTRRSDIEAAAKPGHEARNGDIKTSMRDVPNTLRARIVDRLGDAEVERMVERASYQMADSQFVSSLQEIDRLVGSISALFNAKGPAEELTRELQRLIIASDAWRRHYDGKSKEVVGNLGGMLITLARRILGASTLRRPVEVDLLEQLNQAVRASVDVDHREAKYFAEITDIITRFTGGS